MTLQGSDEVSVAARPRKSFHWWLAAVLLAGSCLTFVILFGQTRMFRDGGLLAGLVALGLAALAVCRIKQLEAATEESLAHESTGE
ncbi:hypothetical protein [Desulfuromonas thiophila]|uniref:Uncharacterized protein n=2 Tax=Desulfuromonas thiophila TaxID=57664 RepID=A0A1G7B9Y1_9BACT|nr:hypothetical protein [Desulfuromonas thiophila]SDE23146.1 hypothetical protein SAMN05661003_105106 [Desulfuromonas thiophila]